MPAKRELFPSCWEGDSILDASSSPLNWFGLSKAPKARDVIARANAPVRIPISLWER